MLPDAVLRPSTMFFIKRRLLILVFLILFFRLPSGVELVALIVFQCPQQPRRRMGRGMHGG
jgi:hypothetical protein